MTPDVVYFKLANLNPAKASGPEGWPLSSLKEHACELSIPLSILFVKSLDSSTLPTAWKEACVMLLQIQDHLNTNNLLNMALLWVILVLSSYLLLLIHGPKLLKKDTQLTLSMLKHSTRCPMVN